MSSSKWLLATVVVSVALNVALGGFIAGRLSGPGPAPAGLDPSLSMFRVLHELPEARRDALRPVMHDRFRALRGDLRRLRTAQHHINEALAEPAFDEAGLREALEEFRGALLDSQQSTHESLVRIAAAMTPEERLLLRQAMSRPRHDHERRPGARGGPDGERYRPDSGPGTDPHRAGR